MMRTLIHSGSRHIVGAQGRRKLWVNQLGKEQCIRWDVHSVAYNNNNKHGDLSKPVVFPSHLTLQSWQYRVSTFPGYFYRSHIQDDTLPPDIIPTIQAWRSKGAEGKVAHQRNRSPPQKCSPNICYCISLARALFQGHCMQHKCQRGLRFCFVLSKCVTSANKIGIL